MRLHFTFTALRIPPHLKSNLLETLNICKCDETTQNTGNHPSKNLLEDSIYLFIWVFSLPKSYLISLRDRGSGHKEITSILVVFLADRQHHH